MIITSVLRDKFLNGIAVVETELVKEEFKKAEIFADVYPLTTHPVTEPGAIQTMKSDAADLTIVGVEPGEFINMIRQALLKYRDCAFFDAPYYSPESMDSLAENILIRVHWKHAMETMNLILNDIYRGLLENE